MMFQLFLNQTGCYNHDKAPKAKVQGEKERRERRGVETVSVRDESWQRGDGELQEDVTSLGSVGRDDEPGWPGAKHKGSIGPSLSDLDRNKVPTHISNSVPVPLPVSNPFLVD